VFSEEGCLYSIIDQIFHSIKVSNSMGFIV